MRMRSFAKRGEESFSEVVCRAVFVDAPAMGAALRECFHKGGSGGSDNLNPVFLSLRLCVKLIQSFVSSRLCVSTASIS